MIVQLPITLSDENVINPVFPQTMPSPNPRSSPRLNKARSHALGVALAPRSRKFLWTQVQVKGWEKIRDTPGDQVNLEK